MRTFRGRLAISFGVALALLAATRPSPSAQSLSESAARAAERVRALQKEADALAGQARTLLGDLRKLEIERDLRLEESQRLDAEAAALSTQIAETTAHIEALQAAIERERPSLEARLVEVYKLGRPGYARVLLGVNDLRQVGRTSRLVTTLAAQDQRRVAAFAADRSRLQASKSELTRQAATLADLQAKARVASEQATRAAAARAAMVRDIDARRDLNAQMVAELEQARARVAKALEALPGGEGADEAAVLPLRPFKGDLPWPIAGRLGSRFGQHRSAFGTVTTQSGVEIEAAQGTTVRAIHDGRVAFADVFTGFGQLVIIDHGNLAYSLYGYLGAITVPRQAAVRAGQAIGSCGRAPTGNSALYFELRIDAKPVDPVQWLKARSPRLPSVP